MSQISGKTPSPPNLFLTGKLMVIKGEMWQNFENQGPKLINSDVLTIIIFLIHSQGLTLFDISALFAELQKF